MILKKQKFKRGFTLVELLLVLPLISIILIASYNVLFLSHKGFTDLNENIAQNEELRTFLNIIRQEANSSKKTNEKTDASKRESLHSKDSNTLYIYADIDGDGIPELIKYHLQDKKIYRSEKKTTNTSFPYYYTESNFTNEKLVLTNVQNDGIFGNVEAFDQDATLKNKLKDFRRKIKMTLEVGKDDSDLIYVETYLTTKSRAEAN